jgi:hypothetical protein
MTRPLPRAHFNSSRLVRFLTENAMLDAVRGADDVGQKLGDWLNFRQAIALHAMLNPEAPTEQPAHLRRAALMTGEALSRHVEKIRAQLEQSILQGAPSGSGLARIDMPPAELDEPIEPKTAFEPYRRFYAAHQRQMETTLQALRSQVRGQLTKSAGTLQQLAALDAAFDNILSEREAVLLAKVAKLHEKRFAQAVKTHLKRQAEAASLALAGDAQADPPSDTNKPASPATPSPATWLLPLRQAMRSALLAELDTRMQPTLGLLEAFTQANAQEQ